MKQGNWHSAWSSTCHETAVKNRQDVADKCKNLQM